MALPLFAITLTIVFFLLLFISERRETIAIKYHLNDKFFRYLYPLALSLVLIVLFVLGISPYFKTSLQYQLALTVIIGATLLILLSSASESRVPTLLVLVLLIHISIVFTVLSGLWFDEWHPTFSRMIETGHYMPLGKRYTYAPFAAHAALQVMLSLVTQIPIISRVSYWIPRACSLIILDLSLFVLLKRLLKDYRIGLLAIILCSVTPPANFFDHLAELAGTTLTLLMLSMLTFKRYTLREVFIGIVICTAMIFYHASAALGLIALACIVLYYVFAQKVYGGYRNTYNYKLASMILVPATILTLIKWGFGGGFREIIPSLYSNFRCLILGEVNRGVSVALYQRFGVNPLHALPWALPVSLAASLLLRSLLCRRNAEQGLMLIIPIALGGLLTLLLGFTSAYFRTGFWGSTYPGYALLMPAAAITLRKVSWSKKLLIFVLGLFILSSFLATGDPMLLPGGYGELKGFETPGRKQYIVISNIHSLIPTWHKVRPTKELAIPYGYIDPYMKFNPVIYEPADPKYQRDLPVIRGELNPNVIYILEWNQIFKYFSNGHLGNTKVNILYNNGEYLALNKVS